MSFSIELGMQLSVIFMLSGGGFSFLLPSRALLAAVVTDMPAFFAAVVV